MCVHGVHVYACMYMCVCICACSCLCMWMCVLLGKFGLGNLDLVTHNL